MFFADDDGDTLTLSATVSGTSVSVAIAGKTLTVTELTTGVSIEYYSNS